MILVKIETSIIQNDKNFYHQFGSILKGMLHSRFQSNKIIIRHNCSHHYSEPMQKDFYLIEILVPANLWNETSISGLPELCCRLLRSDLLKDNADPLVSCQISKIDHYHSS